ncbi:MAG: biopolymer transporter ExbD [Armatimonadota bacterium]|nr:biopolymer transporter ExbD [Armatimonadota bacterium]MCX7776492.1 biopolymer transporter ExbD [Armatimonadota bacterium]MDW8024289.1 biopolymer transporter ExbD [Armatimonadota bacterium]
MLQRRRRLTPTIPMVTMADIAFLLIIFFLLTTTFSRDTGLKLKLPGALSPQPIRQQEITIRITAERQILLDEQRVSPSQLEAALRKRIQETGTREVVIRGDAEIPYWVAVAVMDAVKRVGARAAALAAEPVPRIEWERWERKQ